MQECLSRVFLKTFSQNTKREYFFCLVCFCLTFFIFSLFFLFCLVLAYRFLFPDFLAVGNILAQFP